MAATSPADDAYSAAELAEQISGLGIAKEAVQVYLHLLWDEDWSLESVAEHLDTSLDSVRSDLDDLVRSGLIVRPDAGSDVLHTVHPKVAMTRLVDAGRARLRDAEVGLAQARQAAEALIEMSTDLTALQTQSIEVVDGRFVVTDRISELLMEAHTEVLTVLTGRPRPGAIEHAKSSDAALLARGIRCRVMVLEGSLRGSPELAAHLRFLHEAGAEVRVATYLPSRMIVIDRSTAVLPQSQDSPTEGAVLVQQPVLVGLIAHFFETAWRGSRPFLGEVSTEHDEWQPSPLEREVIRLLAEGNKDEAVARRVGMSLRSVRRLIAGLSASLDAESRFALGVRCAEGGWLPCGPGASEGSTASDDDLADPTA